MRLVSAVFGEVRHGDDADMTRGCDRDHEHEHDD